jgi:hypothetical protein
LNLAIVANNYPGTDVYISSDNAVFSNNHILSNLGVVPDLCAFGYDGTGVYFCGWMYISHIGQGYGTKPLITT